MLPYNKNLKQRSRELRSSMTEAEVALWTKLKRKQLYDLQFHRQEIPLTPFIKGGWGDFSSSTSIVQQQSWSSKSTADSITKKKVCFVILTEIAA